MAKYFGNLGIPVDEPIILRPGVMLREADCHGNARNIALEPEHEERTAKGDLGWSNPKDFPSKPLRHEGLPFVLKGR